MEYILRGTLMLVFKHPKFYAELRKKRKQLLKEEKLKQATSEQTRTSSGSVTNKQQASNQQASKVSSTVDQDPGSTDEQA